MLRWQVTLYCDGRPLHNPATQLCDEFVLKLASDEVHAVHDELFRVRRNCEASAADVCELQLTVRRLRGVVAALATILTIAVIALVGLGGSGERGRGRGRAR